MISVKEENDNLTTSNEEKGISNDNKTNDDKHLSPHLKSNPRSGSLLSILVVHPLHKLRARTMKLGRQMMNSSEISGSLGDLGTLIPLMVMMARQRSILLSPALFFAGLSNVITGYTWDVPMCVQPMKSIAAVAIADELSSNEVTAAGIWTGGFMLFIGVTGFIEVVNNIITGNVVSGIQVGVGIKLAGKGVAMVQNLGWLGRGEMETNTSTVVDERNPDSILLAVICSLFVLYWLRVNNINSHEGNFNIQGNTEQKQQQEDAISTSQKKGCFSKQNRPASQFQHPVGLYLLFIGIIFATITLFTTENKNEQYDLPLRFFGAPIAVWAIDSMTANDWKTGLLEGAIPQIPLTTLNSVISVCALAQSLFPKSDNNREGNGRVHDNKHIPSRREVSISVGLINLLFCPFGSMPNCHGAGGLAAQYRLGARHGASVLFLGIAKILLAIFFGASALTLLDALPEAVLGVMLVIAGVELTVTGLVFLVDYSAKRVISKQNQFGEYFNLRHTNSSKSLVAQNLGDKDEQSHVQQQPERSLDVEDQEEMQLQNQKWEAFKKECLRRDTVVTVITAAVIISSGKTHYGALSGWVTHLIFNNGWSDIYDQIGFCGRAGRR